MKYHIPTDIQLYKLFLRVNTENATRVAQEVDETVADPLVPGSFAAIVADSNSFDTVWFIQIVESNCVRDEKLRGGLQLEGFHSEKHRLHGHH